MRRLRASDTRRRRQLWRSEGSSCSRWRWLSGRSRQSRLSRSSCMPSWLRTLCTRSARSTGPSCTATPGQRRMSPGTWRPRSECTSPTPSSSRSRRTQGHQRTLRSPKTCRRRTWPGWRRPPRSTRPRLAQNSCSKWSWPTCTSRSLRTFRSRRSPLRRCRPRSQSRRRRDRRRWSRTTARQP